ncbi:MAG: LarC family nickel insertion protein [Desulfotomaculaceae bacterium]|nr:LarC family nickel insertion protein [Desulfotomaculaceae bacterium]
MKVIYIDCSAGLSGSALLAALVELGANPELLEKKINSIVAIPFQLTFSKRHINSTTTTATTLKVDARQKDVPAAALVNHLTTKVSTDDELGYKLNFFFEKFIQAKAKSQGLPIAQVVLPEVEILRMAIIAAGFITALGQLKIERITASPLPVGFHLSAHNSAPLLLELARGTAVKQYEGRDVHTTPLGVALLTCLADEYGPLPEILLSETGYGSASEDLLENAQVRILYGTGRDRETPLGRSATITVVETAIDDMNPEFFPFLVDSLLTGGAADAFLIPIYMKKGRPAHLLTVLCSRSRLEDILSIIFKEATTLGVRIREEQRRVLTRYFFEVRTSYGKVAVKAGCLIEGGPPVHYAPEFKDCKKLALQLDVPLKEVYAAAQRAAHEYIVKQHTANEWRR